MFSAATSARGPPSAPPYRGEQQLHLAKHYGYPCLHPEQQTAIDAVLSGRDVSITAPTSFGKSLCYIIPALVSFHLPSPSTGEPVHAVTIVVSPLLALIQDQCVGLASKSIPAAMISSSRSPKQNADVLSSLTGAFPPPCALLYVTAERVTSASFLNTLALMHRRGRVACLAVDEAHCISQWGHDFRHAYSQLGVLRGVLRGVPIIALTGSARPRVAASILESLRIPDAVRVQKSFLRSNIRYTVEYVDGSLCASSVEEHMVDYILARPGQVGIVYVHKRDQVERVVQLLARRGVACVGYHGGLSNKDKRAVQAEFDGGKATVCVCTNAFGMGVDASCVRYVLNHSLPSSLEAYYQESGRAGRDGLASASVLYYGQEDARLKRYLAASPRPGATPDKDAAAKAERALAALEAVVAYCTSAACRRVTLLKHFGERVSAADVCGAHGCDVCADVRDVKRRMIAAVPRSRGRGRFIGGFASASSLATPAVEFQTARALARAAVPEDPIGPGDGDEDHRRGEDGNDEAAAQADGDGPAVPTKSIARLLAEEERQQAATALLTRPKARLRQRLGGGGGGGGRRPPDLSGGFQSARTAFASRDNSSAGGVRGGFRPAAQVDGSSLNAAAAARAPRKKSAPTAGTHRGDGAGLSSDPSVEFVREVKRRRR
jgi:ATP-dependent DNA helicase RecQ